MNPPTGRLHVAVDMTLLDGRIGGSTVYATSLVEALRKRSDVDIQVIAASQVQRLATARWMLRDANIRLRQVRAEVLHAPAFFAPINPSVPVVLTIHDLSLTRMPGGHPFEWRMYATVVLPRLARRAAMLITPTEAVRRDAIETYRIAPERVVAIHSGIDERFFELTPARHETASRATPLVLFPGAPIARKNLDIVLGAMASAPPGGKLAGARLEITGADVSDFPHYVHMIDELGLRDRVKWMGRLSFEEMAAAYERADVVVYPSLIEGFGFAPLEAMAAGIPVVASNASCLPEVLDDGALLVDPHDNASFASSLTAALTDDALRTKLIAAGRARARTFTWARAAAQTAEVYQRAASPANSVLAKD